MCNDITISDKEVLIEEKARIQRRNKRCKLADYKVEQVGGYIENDEIFVQVVGFPGYYISNHGRVISTRQGNEPRLRNIQTKKNQYLDMQMCKPKKKNINIYLHRAVAETFCPNIFKNTDEQLDVHHLNYNKKDNRPENLILLPKKLHKYCNYIGNFGLWRNKSAKHLHPLDIVEKTGLNLEDIIFAIKNKPIKSAGDWSIYNIKGHMVALEVLADIDDNGNFNLCNKVKKRSKSISKKSA